MAKKTTNRARGAISLDRHARTARGAWVVIARIPQMGGAVREVLVERRHAREVREVLREDPARIDRLWCPVRTREV